MANPINPREITDFNRSEGDLQRFLIFCICVAGKPAQVTSKKLADAAFWNQELPLAYVLSNSSLLTDLHQIKIGQYGRILNAILSLAVKVGSGELNLFSCAASDLEVIPGIGPKTSRFFILHSRTNQRVAVLDRHILRYMKENSLDTNVPKNTPSGKKYARLETKFIEYCDGLGKSIAEVDLEIWKTYQKQKKEPEVAIADFGERVAIADFGERREFSGLFKESVLEKLAQNGSAQEPGKNPEELLAIPVAKSYNRDKELKLTMTQL